MNETFSLIEKYILRQTDRWTDKGQMDRQIQIRLKKYIFVQTDRWTCKRTDGQMDAGG